MNAVFFGLNDYPCRLTLPNFFMHVRRLRYPVSSSFQCQRLHGGATDGGVGYQSKGRHKEITNMSTHIPAHIVILS